jgi:hypothetical protein
LKYLHKGRVWGGSEGPEREEGQQGQPVCCAQALSYFYKCNKWPNHGTIGQFPATC